MPIRAFLGSVATWSASDTFRGLRIYTQPTLDRHLGRIRRDDIPVFRDAIRANVSATRSRH